MIPPQFVLQCLSAGLNVLFPTFFFQPRTNFRTSFSCLYDIQPIPIRPFVRVFRAFNFTNLSNLQRLIQWHKFSVDLCPNHTISDFGMNPVSEINWCRTLWQENRLALWCQDSNILPSIVFQIADKFFHVIGILLFFNQLSCPVRPLIHISAGFSLLIFPVGNNSVFGCLMHRMRPNLHFKRQPIGINRHVNGTVAVRLWHGNIVFRPIRQRLIKHPDHAHGNITFFHGIHDNPSRIFVIHF